MIQKCNAQINIFCLSVQLLATRWRAIIDIQIIEFCTLANFISSHLVAKLISNASGTIKWHDPVAKFPTNASGAIRRPNFELM